MYQLIVLKWTDIYIILLKKKSKNIYYKVFSVIHILRTYISPLEQPIQVNPFTKLITYLGSNHDIIIYSESNNNYSSHSTLKGTFGSKQNCDYYELAGELYFKVKEIEVFQVEIN